MIELRLIEERELPKRKCPANVDPRFSAMSTS
jgi:hypothetical protein